MINGLLHALVLDEKGGNGKALSSEEDLAIALPHAALNRAKELAKGLNLPSLDRAWNILSKGIQEIKKSLVSNWKMIIN